MTYYYSKNGSVTQSEEKPEGWMDWEEFQQWSLDNPYSPADKDHDIINGKKVKVIYSKKEFMLWCGLDKIIAINTLINNGNPVVSSIKDLLMAAEYIDIRDSDTAQMLEMLASSAGNEILTSSDVERILGGQEV